MKEIKNIRELTADLGRVYAELRAREIEIKEASEIANIAGKIINGAKAEMMYRIARKEKPSIPFFDVSVALLSRIVVVLSQKRGGTPSFYTIV